MSEEQYIKLTYYFKKNKLREKSVTISCEILPLFLILVYTASTLFLIINKNRNILLFLAVPASNFIFISVLRKIIDTPRPYDIFEYTPLIKHSSGKSFPSRHTSSAFIIAFSYFYLGHIHFGLFMSIIAILIGLSRIICGVHFPKDVISAFLISFIWALIGFNLPLFN